MSVDVRIGARNRRILHGVALLIIMLAVLASVDVFAVRAPLPTSTARVGVLSPFFPGEAYVEAFRDELHALGYVEGQNLTIEYRFAEGQAERLPGLATELVQQQVDVILGIAPAAAVAAKQATSTIPIVFCCPGDPVGDGLTAGFAQPSGNATGVSGTGPEFVGKQLELLKEIAPTVSHIGVLWKPEPPGPSPAFSALEDAARRLGIQLESLEVEGPDDLATAFRAAERAGVDGLLVSGDALFVAHRRSIVEFTTEHRLPSIFFFRDFVAVGGLVSYAPDLAGMFRRTATYVERILKGATPSSLPVERPSQFDLIINLQTARALGLSLPPALLMDADEVIQ